MRREEGKAEKKREVRNWLSRNHALSYIITIRVRTANGGFWDT